MTPYVQDADFTLYVGDVRDCLRELPAESVHTVVTSPPYWGLRDYGTGAWEGGDEGCDHKAGSDYGEKSDTNKGAIRGGPFKEACGKCGATRVDQQLGLEPTPEAFVAAMVDVFREVRRVLRDDGTLWLNLGDSYMARQFGWNTSDDRSWAAYHREAGDTREKAPRTGHPMEASGAMAEATGLKPKDLVGIPWKTAFALQADGWYLRSDIIWSKPNPMPESVTDRPTKAHEYVFLLSKGPRYFFDQEAVREPNSSPEQLAHNLRYAREYDAHTANVENGAKQPGNVGSVGIHSRPGTAAGRNVRSVWEIATQPYPEAHFATFPEALPERCIKAGTSERGCCPECGAPLIRVTGRDEQPQAYEDRKYDRSDPKFATKRNMGGRYQAQLDANPMRTLEWLASCECGVDQTVPCTVLDPFMGSGTTALVARRLGRKSVGVELNPEYAALCARRLQQLSLEFA